jgi:hypothetical protein
MNMSNREHLICLAAVTALVAFSGVARADDESRSEELAKPMTCAQATAFAWFKHQMEIPDIDNPIAAPVECERTNVANREEPSGDREAYEESK